MGGSVDPIAIIECGHGNILHATGIPTNLSKTKSGTKSLKSGIFGLKSGHS